jgi:hypothetical protein
VEVGEFPVQGQLGLHSKTLFQQQPQQLYEKPKFLHITGGNVKIIGFEKQFTIFLIKKNAIPYSNPTSQYIPK